MRQASRLLEEGADWLDIGGQSTRPGAEIVGEEEELRRVVGAIDLLHREWPEVVLSVDTWHARVARVAVEAGAGMVNDVSGGAVDTAMLETVGALRVPYICMHMKGTPATMNREAQYENVVTAVLDYFVGRIEACRRAGIYDVILDPGFGFAKTASAQFPDPASACGPADLRQAAVAGGFAQIHDLSDAWSDPRRGVEWQHGAPYAGAVEWRGYPAGARSESGAGSHCFAGRIQKRALTKSAPPALLVVWHS